MSALFETEDAGVTRDLMKKLSADITATVMRAIDLAPPPRLPILTAAACTAAALMATELDTEHSTTPQRDCLLLAGLLIARTIDKDGIRLAYEDFEILRKAGRV